MLFLLWKMKINNSDSKNGGKKRRKESDLEVQKNQIKKKEQAGFDRKTYFNLQILCSPTYHPELPVIRKHELYYAT
jgi:hypothetical protein